MDFKAIQDDRFRKNRFSLIGNYGSYVSLIALYYIYSFLSSLNKVRINCACQNQINK